MSCLLQRDTTTYKSQRCIAAEAFDRRARARCCSPDGGDLAAVRFQMDAWSSGMMYIISMYVYRYDMSAREAGAQTSNCSKSSSNTDSNCSGSIGPSSEQAINCAIGLSNWNPRRQMCHLLRI